MKKHPKKQPLPSREAVGAIQKNIFNTMNYNTNRSLKSRFSGENPFFQDFSVQANQFAEIPCRLKNPCKGCGGKSGIITPVDRATGNPHSYRLECGDCGRFQRWIGQKEFDRKLGRQGGREDA